MCIRKEVRKGLKQAFDPKYVGSVSFFATRGNPRGGKRRCLSSPHNASEIEVLFVLSFSFPFLFFFFLSLLLSLFLLERVQYELILEGMKMEETFFRGIRLYNSPPNTESSRSENSLERKKLGSSHEAEEAGHTENVSKKKKSLHASNIRGVSPIPLSEILTQTLTPSDIVFLSDQSRRGLLHGPTMVQDYLQRTYGNEEMSEREVRPFAGSTFEHSAPRSDQLEKPSSKWLETLRGTNTQALNTYPLLHLN